MTQVCSSVYPFKFKDPSSQQIGSDVASSQLPKESALAECLERHNAQQTSEEMPHS